ncbi:MAG: putative Ig domain-containing protein [Bacteroidales bacterium]|jgi:hypothetical protein|nr:putative Ig domain-containing protein [Bacteroidales bacterium]
MKRLLTIVLAITVLFVTCDKNPDTVHVTGVSLNKSTLSLTEGTSETLTAAVTPAEAGNKKITWKSDKPDIATVDAEGKVTAVKAGTAIITVTAEDGLKTAACTVTVKAVEESLTVVDEENEKYDIPAMTAGMAIAGIDISKAVTGGVAPYAYTATGFPEGIVIDPSTGVISGTPVGTSESGTATVTITDSSEPAQSVTVDIDFGATTVTPPPAFIDNASFDIPAMTVGTAIAPVNVAGAASGGATPYAFSASGLPAGISISAAGVISGTPTAEAAAGTATITVTDAASQSSKIIINFGAVAPAEPTFNDNGEYNIPAMTQGTAIADIDLSEAITGGKPPYYYEATGLPEGLVIDPSTGVISGTPVGTSESGTATITITDSSEPAKSVTVDINFGAVTTVPPPAFTDNASFDIPAMTAGTAITPINVADAAEGGTPPYTFSANGLPAGVSISEAGVISGTPTAPAAPGTATITVTDAASKSSNITIDFGAIAPAALVFTDNDNYNIPAITVGTAITPIDVAGAVTGGTTPYAFSASGLPAGISISAAGVISGTPTAEAAAGTATITIKDSSSPQKSSNITIGFSAITPTELVFIDNDNYNIPDIKVGVAITPINVAGAVTGGITPYAFSASGLPAGLSISAAGVISGTPTTEAAASTATINVKDKSSSTQSKNITVSYGAATPTELVFTDNDNYNIPDMKFGVAITPVNVAGAVTGGITPYAFSASGLPAGISISPAGVISGTPTAEAAAGTATITVTDKSSSPQSKNITVNYGSITPTELVFTDSPSYDIPATNITTSISIDVAGAASGGIKPYTFSASGLPEGISISQAGLISGTPTAVGSGGTATITVTDKSSSQQSKNITINFGEITYVIPRRITWNGSGYVFATEPNDAGLFFKFGGVTGIYTGNGKVTMLPAAANGDTFTTADVAWSPVAVSSWTSIPYSTQTVNDAYHTVANVKAGKGDPCRLVGLDLNKIKNTPAGSLTHADIDNGEWRLPTVVELHTFTGQSANVNGFSAHWTNVNGANGSIFPTVAAGNMSSFIPATGFRSSSVGTVTDQNIEDNYWSGTAHDADHGYYMENASTYVRSYYLPVDVQYGLAVRCLKQ